MATGNLGELAAAHVSINVDAAGFGRQLNQAQGMLRSTAKSMSAELTAVGKSLGAVGAVATGAFAGTIKVASDFESAFAGVRKTVDASEEEFAALDRGLRDMAGSIPVARTELAGIMEIAGQLGVRGTDNLLKFTRVAADLGVTTNLSSEAAATSLARFVNVTGGSLDEVDRLGSVIVDLGNNFATTESEIAELAQRMAGLAPAAGFTQQEILGLAAGLSAVGVEAQLGGTAVQRIAISMAQAAASGGESLATLSEVAGMAADEFARLVKSDPSAALRQLFAGINKIQTSGGNVFDVLSQLGLDDQRLIGVITKAAGASDLFAEASKRANIAFEENTALADEASKRYETFASQLVVAKNNAMNLVGELGTPALKALASALKDDVIPAVQSMVTMASDWIANNQELAARIILTVGAVGALLVGLGGFLIVLPLIISGFAALLGPVGIAIGLIGSGLMAAFMAATEGAGSFRERVEALIPRVIEFAQTAWAWIQAFAERVRPALEEIAEIVQTRLLQAFESIREFWASNGETIKAGASLAFDFMLVALPAVLDAMLGLLTFLYNVFLGNWEKAWEQVKTVFLVFNDALFTAFSSWSRWILRTIDLVIDKIGELLRALNPLNGGIGSQILNALVPGSGAIGALGGAIPGGATGGSILSAGLIDVHAGERIFLNEGAQIQRAGDVGNESAGAQRAGGVIELHIHGNVYGIDDIVQQVDQGLARLQSRRFRDMGVSP